MSDVKGTESYFPSIEKKCGEPVEHWTRRLESAETAEHMEEVTLLEDRCGSGHGHADAPVAVVRRERGL